MQSKINFKENYLDNFLFFLFCLEIKLKNIKTLVIEIGIKKKSNDMYV